MTDKKLTDNEIIEIIERCIKSNHNHEKCVRCYFEHNDCIKPHLGEALDIINRQKAEIKKSDRAFEELIEVARLWKEKYNNAKAEADALTKEVEQLLKSAVERNDWDGV